MGVNSPLKWVGGKSASAERIVAAFPDPSTYDIYVEPCGGAAHVFCRKPSYGHHEIFCDLDGNLVEFWMEMIEHGEELAADLDELPFARSLYYQWYRSLFDGTELSQGERARRFFYCLRGTGTGWMRRSPPGWVGCLKSSASAYHNAIDLFKEVQVRFRNVVIDSRDVLATIRRYDSPRTLFYIDPPYIGAEHYYEVSRKGFPHAEMAKLLREVKGKVALSGYPHPLLDDWYGDWRRISWQQSKSSQIQIERRPEDIATEMLFMNYGERKQESLWEGKQEEEEEDASLL